MTIRTESWPAGTPAWVDLNVPDRSVAQRFYGELFGWEFTPDGPEETGYYSNALVNGQPAAGLGQAPAEAGIPALWTTYLATDDAASTVDKVTASGGQVLVPATPIEGFGDFAVVQDPTGAVFGLWQSGSHTGANVVNESNTMIWNQAMTRDPAAALGFYQEVFGMTSTDIGGDSMVFHTLELGGNTVGGLGALPDEVPAEVPAHWEVFFAVEDADATIGKAQELGGTVLSPAMDTPFGRMAQLVGPSGEPFSIIKPPDDDGSESDL
ncbi:MAG: VOC family protein [Nocardioidaceae bacterium]